MAPRSSRSVSTVTDESTAPVTDESTSAAEGGDATPATEQLAEPAPELTPERQAEAAKIAERKAKAKERREHIRREQEEAGLVLKREYTTADGATFKTKREAAIHIAVLKFRDLISGNPLITAEGYTVDPESLSNWLRTHKDAVASYLREVKD